MARRFAPGEIRLALGLAALAGLHRLLFLLSNRDRAWPFTIFYEGDAETFYRYARSLLAGELYDNGIPFHPPAFAWLLAGLHALLGAGGAQAAVPHLAVKAILGIVLGGGAVGLLYLLARPYLGPTVALVSALLAAWHFGLAVLAIAPVTEGLYLFVLLALLLVWTRGFDSVLAAPSESRVQSAAGALLWGGLGGLLALVRAEGLLVFALLLAIGLGSAWRSRRRLGPWLLAGLGGVLVLAPWTIRNAVRLGALEERLGPRLAEPLPRFVPLTLYGPINLALANNPQADGGFSRAFLASQAHSAVLDLTDPQHLEFLLHGDRMAWRYVREQPGAWGRLAVRKVRLFLGALELGWSQWNLPGGLSGQRRPVDIFVPKRSTALWLQLPLVVLGFGLLLAQGGAERRWALLVGSLTLLSLAVTVAFFGYARLGLLLVPFWLGLEVGGLGLLVRRFVPAAARTGSGRRRGLVVLVLAVLALEGFGATRDRNYRASGTNVPGQSYLDRDAPVELEPIR